MLKILLFAFAATALLSQRFVDNQDGYVFRQFPRKGSKAGLSDLKTTENVLQLKKVNMPSLSARILQTMRLQEYGIIKRSANASAELLNVEIGQVFVAPITVGGQNFEVVIDSGSSDPWLASTGFICFDPATGDPLDETDCSFGPLYNSAKSSTYASISNLNFNVTYADDETMTGTMAYETMSLGGITITQQEFGVVNSASWYGDGNSSGLVGFAYRSLTSAYSGTDTKADKPSNAMNYNPLFVNMYTQHNIPPIFSVVLNRNVTGGGLLGLGGIPAGVAYSPYFANTPIIPSGVYAGSLVYEFYAVELTGFAVSDSTSTQFNPYNTNNPLKTPLVGMGTQVIIDSGTSLVYVPDDVAAQLASLFDPPAKWEQARLAYVVDCDAEPPVFGAAIAEKIFYVNGQDMFVQVNGTACITGVQPSLGGLSILGGTWLKNVVAVFDIGAEQMRFAAREFYSIYNASIEQNARNV